MSIYKKTISDEELSPHTKTQILKSNGTIGNSERLVADHSDMTRYMISLERLQVLYKIGIKVTCVHHVFRFRQEAYLENFINANIEARNKATDPFRKSLFKLLNNSVFGKLLFNARKNELKTKMVKEKWHFEKLVNSVLIVDCQIISDECILLKHHSESIHFTHALHVGWFITDRSKAHMYNNYHLELKKDYGSDINLLYTDTDSLFIKLTNHEFQKDILEWQNYILDI